SSATGLKGSRVSGREALEALEAQGDAPAGGDSRRRVRLSALLSRSRDLGDQSSSRLLRRKRRRPTRPASSTGMITTNRKKLLSIHSIMSVRSFLARLPERGNEARHQAPRTPGRPIRVLVESRR